MSVCLSVSVLDTLMSLKSVKVKLIEMSPGCGLVVIQGAVYYMGPGAPTRREGTGSRHPSGQSRMMRDSYLYRGHNFLPVDVACLSAD